MSQAQTIGPKADAAPPEAKAAPARKAAQRRKWLIRLAIAVAVAGAVWFLYWLLVGSRRVVTDDAYVQADVAQVTALVSGTVVSAPVGETQVVRKGQVLAVIDPADYRLAVDRARAELGQAERRVRQYQANDQALAAQTKARASDVAKAQAQLTSARSDLARAEAEYNRRRSLAGSGAVSADELTVAQNALQTARADLASAEAGVVQARANTVVAREQRNAAAALIKGAGVADNPEVAAARAKLGQAELDLSRTVVRAPQAGIVAKKTIEVGQRVPMGAQLMSVAPIQDAYVDANFKEVQLNKIHVGSPVELTSDIYGGGVKFHGKVMGIAGGSGSAFALIPAQNATGNWIKVVQRVPVRISLDPHELAKHPLRVGVSMKAVVKVD
jgi:membrane fusion protein (multidrug efflux system)